MINKISQFNCNPMSFKQQKNNEVQNNSLGTKAAVFADSFAKHTVDSAPMLFSLTTVWALMEKAAKKISFTKAFANNIKYYFVPVILTSSAVLSAIENKERLKNNT